MTETRDELFEATNVMELIDRLRKLAESYRMQSEYACHTNNARSHAMADAATQLELLISTENASV